MNHHRRLCLGIVFTVCAMGLALLPTVTASATVGMMQITVDTTLTEDHNGRIEIVADDVTLDCAGHNVEGPAATDPNAGIQVFDQSGVTVRNCDVSGFVVGILLHNVQGSTFEDNMLHDNVLGDGAVGIGMTLSTGNTVKNNVVTGNATNGIHVHGGSDGNLVEGNTVTGNGLDGIRVGGNSDRAIKSTTIRSNVVKGNAENGIMLFWAAEATIIGNTLEDNVVHGIAMYSSKVLTVTGNTTSGNGVGGADGHGMKIRLTGGSTFTDNTANGNIVSGFFTDGIGNTFTGNESHRNGDYGIDDDAAVGASTYSKNHCTGNSTGGSAPSGLCQEERVGLVDASQGMWYLRYGEGTLKSFFYGNPGDVPFMGDWDCDGNATPGLFRTSDAYAYLRNSNSQGNADIRFFFGNPSDIPLAGDFNGDGCDTLSIYRPSQARFYIMNELGENEGGLGAAEYSFLFGNPGDKPVVGDWDSDGIDEIGLHRELTGFFYYRNTLTTGIADGQFFFGNSGDRFVAGDWGVVDGAETPAMFRPSNMAFYFRWTLTQGNADSQFTWPGAGTDWLPVSGNFTLD